MNEWLDIGSSPPDEDCAQVGSADYSARARRECRAYINQLRRVFGPEPAGAQLGVRSNPHDFGNYLSVVCYYDPQIKQTVDYAFRCESNGPEEWDAEARRELAHTKGVHHE